MPLLDAIIIGGVFQNTAVRRTNTTGTPVVSAVTNGEGRLIADEYYLTFSDVIAGVSATVNVLSGSPNNPYRASSPVILDGVTIHREIIPGLNLVFSNNGAFSNLWAATVNAGEFLGSFDATGIQAGTPSPGVRHRVENTGTGAVTESKARLLPVAKWVKRIGSVFAIVRPFAEGALEKVTPGTNQTAPYVFSVSNVAGAGVNKTCSVSVDGVLLPADSLTLLSSGATQNGNLVKATPTPTYYRINSGDLTGLEFAINANVANGATANLLIFPPRFIQIAPDVGGAEGGYGIADVELTQAGEAPGVIQPGGYAYFWRRVLVPNSSPAESNPYPGDVALEARDAGAANWLA